MKKIVRIVSIVLTSLIALVMAILLYVQTESFNRQLVRMLNSKSGDFIEGELQLGAIEGNLLGDFMLKELVVSQQQKELLQMDSLKLRYDLWELMQGHIHVEYVKLHGLSVNAEQLPDSTWNFEHLFLSDTTKETPAKDTTSHYPYLTVDTILLERITLNVCAIDTSLLVPEFVSLEVLAGLGMNESTIEANLHKLSLVTRAPDLELKQLSLVFKMDEGGVYWEHLLMQLPHTQLVSDGNLNTQEIALSNVQLYSDSLCFQDFAAWLPALPADAAPKLSLDVRADTATTFVHLFLKEDDQELRLEGWVSDFTNLPKYALDLQMANVMPGYWMKRDDLNSVLNTNLQLSGLGFDPKDSRLKVKGDITDVVFQRYNATRIAIDVVKDTSWVDAVIDAFTPMGNVFLDLKAEQLFGVPDYELNAVVERLNLAKVTGDKKLESKLNMRLQAQGVGIDYPSLSSEIHLSSKNSRIFNHSIRALELDAVLDSLNYQLDNQHKPLQYH